MTTLDAGQDALAVVERFNQAWNSHDLPAALALTTDDCIFEATGPAPDGARAHGRAELAAAWEPIFADTSSRFTTEEAFTAGDRVVARWRYDWNGGHVRGIDLVRVRDGRVAEKLSYVKG
ncbi:MAG TPA: nuclear transport factor 2 family protein [Dermatophilaceae bacterium]